MGFGKQLEKKIIGKISAIKNGTKTVKDSGVNEMITKLKAIDEAAAQEMQKKYVEAVKEANDKKDEKS